MFKFYFRLAKNFLRSFLTGVLESGGNFVRIDNIKNHENYRTNLRSSDINVVNSPKTFSNVQNTQGNLMSYASCASMVPFTGKINPETVLKNLISEMDLTRTSGKILPEMITDEIAGLLLKIARRESKKAYPPSSNSKIGAVVLTSDGKLYKGANIEHGSVPQNAQSDRYIPPKFTISAEENALAQVIAAGGKKIVAIVAATKPGAGYDYFPHRQAISLIKELIPQKDARIIIYRDKKPHFDDIIFSNEN